MKFHDHWSHSLQDPKKHELAYMDPDDDDIFKDSIYDHYLKRPTHSAFDSVTFFEFFRKYEIFVKNSKTQIPKSRMENIFIDQKNDRVVKRKKDIITRTNFYNINDGEIYFFQKILYSIGFRNFDELLSLNNITRTYQEECILRNLIGNNESNKDQDIQQIFNGAKNSNNNENNAISLDDEFRRHYLNENYETQKPYEAMIFDDLEVDEDDELGENEDQFYTKESNEADINLESLFSLRQEIPLIIQNLSNDYKRLTQCQKGVIYFIKSQGTNQFLTFIFGPAGTGKTFLLNHIYNFLLVHGFTIAKLATTGLAAKLIKGETAH
ncbi:unnamed protein product [Brachionus calyciflorus]|uniref:ATP-dependent DNA helicase n=1 Tax=Brachionus calyciflorus TaxID=104777 RepID=A0A814D3I8_9BILA|nr:unnamed protein product [Brachionus calyciflorus]